MFLKTKLGLNAKMLVHTFYCPKMIEITEMFLHRVSIQRLTCSILYQPHKRSICLEPTYLRVSQASHTLIILAV